MLIDGDIYTPSEATKKFLQGMNVSWRVGFGNWVQKAPGTGTQLEGDLAGPGGPAPLPDVNAQKIVPSYVARGFLQVADRSAAVGKTVGEAEEIPLIFTLIPVLALLKK